MPLQGLLHFLWHCSAAHCSVEANNPRAAAPGPSPSSPRASACCERECSPCCQQASRGVWTGAETLQQHRQKKCACLVLGRC